MRRIIAAIFMSIDGVMQSPGAPEEDPTGGFDLGGWMVPFWDDELAGLMSDAMGEDYDLLMGRRSYEMLAAFWPYAEGAFADRLNAAAKYVAARPGTILDWSGARRLEGDVVQAVAALKREAGPPLLLQGSGRLIQSLLAVNLIDRITLLVVPVVLGAGKRLFEDGVAAGSWTLTQTQHTAKGMVVSSYERAGDVEIGSQTIGVPSAAEIARRERLAREV